MRLTPNMTSLCARCPALLPTARLLVAGALVAISSAAFAQYEATATADGATIGHTNTPGDVSYSYTYDVGIYKSAAVVAFTSSPIASVSYAGSVFNPVGELKLLGGGLMTYGFEVEAQPFTSVPIDFSGLYWSYQGAPGSRASTAFTIQAYDASGTYSYFQSDLYGDCGGSNCLQFMTFNNTTYTSSQSDALHVEGTFQGSMDMLTGADGKVAGVVRLYAGANIHYSFGGASAASFIDPHLEIDPAFLAANPGATLTITPGVGNEIPAIPEPGTYALMLAGLAAVAAGARRRRVRNAEGALAHG